jgi:hypothetical protein
MSARSRFAPARRDADLRDALPALLPLAISWANAQSRRILAHGIALSDEYATIARRVGVAWPELVRVASVRAMPLPRHAALRDAALKAGLLGPNVIGLTLGHGVLVVSGHATRRLLSHELRHVHQYEQAGSIAAYLPRYLAQIVDVGYFDSPFERDAREHEVAP